MNKSIIILLIICLGSLIIYTFLKINKENIQNIDNNNKISNKKYNSDNLDITYHAEPAVGEMWIKDTNGNLKKVQYNDLSNTTLYYPSGSYVFNPPSYVPNYEESVFLSKFTNLQPVIDISYQEYNICNNTITSKIDREQKCNSLDKESCKKSNCCVLFGGEKCVCGDIKGPSIKSNYSDFTIINRDFYFYKNKCYGNCSQN